MIVADTLRWTDLSRGLRVTSVYDSIAIVFVGLFQGLLGLIFMRRPGDRAWWRTGLVLLPAAWISILCLSNIASLYPHERRARREMAELAGGSLPASVSSVSLDFRGGMDPAWKFHFQISAEDFQLLSSYRDYQQQSPGDYRYYSDGASYDLRYDPRSGLATFQVFLH